MTCLHQSRVIHFWSNVCRWYWLEFHIRNSFQWIFLESIWGPKLDLACIIIGLGFKINPNAIALQATGFISVVSGAGLPLSPCCCFFPHLIQRSKYILGTLDDNCIHEHMGTVRNSGIVFVGLFFFSVDMRNAEEDLPSVLCVCVCVLSGGCDLRDIIHSLWHPFQSTPGGAPQVSCVSLEASWGLGWCAGPGWGQYVQLWCRCEEAVKNGHSVDLISMPLVPGGVPSYHPLKERLQRLVYLLWLYFKVEDSIESAIC